MLKITQIQSPSQTEELFSSFDPQKQSWVVSDLRTKLEMQKVLIERQGYFLESAVLRASDLWKILLKRIAPELRIVSKDFAKPLLRSFITENAETFGINATSEKSLFNYMTQLAPLALAAGSDERISKWFEEHPEISMRWQSWYLIARLALRWMIEDKKVLIADWIPAYLQEVDGIENAWEQDLIVDLGSEMSTVEAEVFQRIGRTQNITVIEPFPEWREEFRYLLQPYEYLRQQTKQIRLHPRGEIPSAPFAALRLSGMLAEVKSACAQVRQWLESGITPSCIAIIASDIEAYWPVLGIYFEQEGIPVQKDQSVKFQSLPGLHQWIASLRSQTSRVSATDLEASFYGRPESQKLRYEEFISLFKAIYGEEDLGRNPQVQELYQKAIPLDKNLNRDEFLALSLKSWPRKDQQTEILIQVLREVFQNASSHIEFSYREWLTYLENILATKELRVVTGVTEGVVVTPLMSAQSYKMSHKIFLGLSEESLKDRQRSHILGSDLNRLALDLGFYLEHPDHSYKEFQLRWLSEAPGIKNIFCFGLADFSGSLLSPSNFWMSLKPPEEIILPLPTRWDQLQCLSDKELLTLRGRTGEEQNSLQLRLEMDQGMRALPAMQLEKVPGLSASQLEKYLKCPFAFAAQKVFKLQDHPDLDLDEDPRSKGTFAHALFEALTLPAFRSELGDEELNQMIEDLKTQQNITLADPRLWAAMKRRYFRLAKRFIKFENEWRQEFPETQTVAAEKGFEFYFNPQSGEVRRDAQPGTLKFSGKIDRIDRHRNQNHFVLIDYKSSVASYKNHNTWFENIELQLLFYMWALEKEMISEVAGEVVGTFYYSFKDFNRSKGFQLDEHAGALFRPAGRKGTKATLEDKKELLKRFEALLLEVVARIKKGEIDPRPFDTKICPSCEWNALCRAPHLN